MIRYSTGLLGSLLVFVAAFALGAISMHVIGGRPVRLTSILDASVQFGLIGTTAIALIVGPIVLATQRLSRGRVSVAAAALVGAVLGPVLLIVLWLLIREGNETFASLLRFWKRVPGELIVGALPHVAAAAFFAGWLVAGRQPSTTPGAG